MELATLILFPFFGFGFVFYFLPSIVALVRGKRDTLSICLLNFFLGWTLNRVDYCVGVGFQSGRRDTRPLNHDRRRPCIYSLLSPSSAATLYAFARVG